MNEQLRKILENIYTDVKHPSGLSSPRRLWEAAKKYGITLKECRHFLQAQDSYTLHKLMPKRFPRRHIIASGPRRILGSDLADLSKLARYNDGVKYLLIVQDIFSRYVRIIAQKRKTAAVTAANLDQIFSEEQFKGVGAFFTDEGGEYFSSECTKVYKKHKIKHYTTFNKITKVALVERYIRCLKSKIFRYLTHNNTKRYIDVLDHITHAHNTQIHRMLNDSPTNVHFHYDKPKIYALYQRLYGTHKKQSRHRQSPIKINDIVRLTSYKRDLVFNKAYEVAATVEKFRVVRINKKQVPEVYYIRDMQNQPIIGTFYRQELILTR